MPDPTWTAEYNTGNSPEENGFTRVLSGSPGVNEVTSGNPANRRVEIDSLDGEAVFITNVPSFNASQGATLEADFNFISANGGNIGAEITFADNAFGATIFENNVEFTLNGIGVETVPVVALGRHTWRMTFLGSMAILYRDEVLVDTVQATQPLSPRIQRALWWVGEGAIGAMHGLRYYTEGAVAPG
jgi:hypothetical protein